MRGVAIEAGFAAALRSPGAPAPGGLGGGLSVARARRGFDVHCNNVACSIHDALAAAFPVVHALVGADCFRNIALGYLRAHPPRSPVLLAYGGRFPHFIARCAHTAPLPYLPDVARLEWLRLRAFHAADAQTLPPDAFARLIERPETLARTRLQLHPACRWLRAAHAAHSIWHAHQAPDGFDPRSLSDVRLGAPEEALCVRPSLQVEVLRAPPGSSALLVALRNGAPIGHALEQALAGNGPRDLQALLAVLLTPGVVRAFDPKEEPA